MLTKHWCGNSQQRRVTRDDLKPNIAALKINVESPQTTSDNNNFFILFIKSILKSLVILAIWLALRDAIYSRIAPVFAVNRVFSSPKENGTVKQNKQSVFKVSLTWAIKFQENKRQKSHCVSNFANTGYLMPKLCCCLFSVSKLTNLVNYSI